MTAALLEKLPRTFDEWWDNRAEWVEPPNSRRDGESGVQRFTLDGKVLYVKRQVNHNHRSFLHPFGRPTILREAETIAAFAALGVHVPRVVYCDARQRNGKWEALLVTEALDGFVSLEDIYGAGGREVVGEALHHRLLEKIGETLARIYRARLQHGALYPKHIMARISGTGVSAEVEIALLDLEKSRKQLTPARTAYRDLAQLHRRKPHWWTAEDWAVLLAQQEQLLGMSVTGPEFDTL